MSDKKAAIITGAGSGVGRELAVQMARTGFAVALAARTEAALLETVRLIDSQAPDAQTLVVPTDVADADAIHALAEATLSRFGRIDAIANIAGYAPLLSIPKITDADLRRVMAVNFDSVVYLTRACWATFERQNHGVVCSVSSMASLDPFTGFNIYGAAKAAVNLFTKAIADEGKTLGIKAYTIAPGAIETPMLRQHFGEDLVPADKTLSPTEVATAVRDCLLGQTDLASGETRAMTSPE